MLSAMFVPLFAGIEVEGPLKAWILDMETCRLQGCAS